MLSKTNNIRNGHLFSPEKQVENHSLFSPSQLIDSNNIEKILVFYNQFYYITDVAEFKNIYVSHNISNVLGYTPESFLSIEQVYESIHPDDRDLVFDFSIKTIEWSRLYPHILLKDPFSAVFSIDFRMKTSDGKYIRVNRQSCCFKTDGAGQMMQAISFFTDITHLKQSNLITFSMKGSKELTIHLEELISKYDHKLLTAREQEIIHFISQGLSATQISKRLFISTNTVIKHRKNIQHKLKAKNTAEMVKQAIELGIVL